MAILALFLCEFGICHCSVTKMKSPSNLFMITAIIYQTQLQDFALLNIHPLHLLGIHMTVLNL